MRAENDEKVRNLQAVAAQNGELQRAITTFSDMSRHADDRVAESEKFVNLQRQELVDARRMLREVEVACETAVND